MRTARLSGARNLFEFIPHSIDNCRPVRNEFRAPHSAYGECAKSVRCVHWPLLHHIKPQRRQSGAIIEFIGLATEIDRNGHTIRKCGLLHLAVRG